MPPFRRHGAPNCSSVFVRARLRNGHSSRSRLGDRATTAAFSVLETLFCEQLTWVRWGGRAINKVRRRGDGFQTVSAPGIGSEVDEDGRPRRRRDQSRRVADEMAPQGRGVIDVEVPRSALSSFGSRSPGPFIAVNAGERFDVVCGFPRAHSPSDRSDRTERAPAVLGALAGALPVPRGTGALTCSSSSRTRRRCSRSAPILLGGGMVAALASRGRHQGPPGPYRWRVHSPGASRPRPPPRRQSDRRR